jgi:hypothetical protein
MRALRRAGPGRMSSSEGTGDHRGEGPCPEGMAGVTALGLRCWLRVCFACPRARGLSPHSSDPSRRFGVDVAKLSAPSRRWRRKHESRLSRVRPGVEHMLWAPHRVSWWIAVLFALGSLCFLAAPLPAFLSRVGPQTVGITFFVGSLLFTLAAALQWLETVNTEYESNEAVGGSLRTFAWRPRGVDWWSSGVQLVGTLFFNVTTFRGLTVAIDSPAYNHVVWQPDALGSVCFLVSGYLAYVEVAGRALGRPRRTVEGGIVTVNLAGCLAFGVAAVTGYVLPATGTPVNVALTNAATSIGALCFLVGALLLLPEGITDSDRPVRGSCSTGH